MTGWCRVQWQNTNQSFGCGSFSSKAAQERDYLERVKRNAPAPSANEEK